MTKVGLVLEGGGMRGAYTAGALAWLNDNNIDFDYSVGISSGAAYLACYLMNDKHTPYNMSVHYASDPAVIGAKAFAQEGHYVAYHYLFDHYLKEEEHFDIKPLVEAKPAMEFGVYDMEAGETKWLKAEDLDENLDLLRAACALPIASAKVKYKGKYYLDGGITKMIPIERAIEQGCDKFLVITTKPKGFVRKPANTAVIAMMKVFYRKFPKVLKDYRVRHINYQKQMKIIEDLVAKKDAVLMRPSVSIPISRFKGDPENLQKLYDLGYQDMEQNRSAILALFAKD